MDCIKVPYDNLHIKTVTLSTTDLGTSFSQASRRVGSVASLFGIAANKVVSICPKNVTLSPGSMFTIGIYGADLWAGATQSCTLSGTIDIVVLYTD